MDKPRYCTTCGDQIPQGRLDIFPNAKKCVKHSTATRHRAFTVNHGKGTRSIQVIENQDTLKKISTLDKTKGRARSGYSGAH